MVKQYRRYVIVLASKMLFLFVKPFSHPSPLTQEEMMRESSLTHLPLASPPYAGRLGKEEMIDAGTWAMAVHAYTSLHAYTTRGLLLLERKREGVSLTLSPSVRDECSTRVEGGDEMLLHYSKSLPASLLLPLSLSHTLTNNTQRNIEQKNSSRFLAQK